MEVVNLDGLTDARKKDGWGELPSSRMLRQEVVAAAQPGDRGGLT